MYTKVRHFMDAWHAECTTTGRVLAALTDESLNQAVAPGFRTLGEIAWHMATSIGGIAGWMGLAVGGPTRQDPMPTTAAGLRAAHEQAASDLAVHVEGEYTDETLKVRDRVYGEDWPRGLTLDVLLRHEIHHRGQLTVLMRQAGLKVPGVYGPSKEEHRK